MKSWLFKSILVIVVFAVVWIMALYYWQTSHRVPNGVDIGIYFFAIPLGILLTIWLGAKSWKAIKNRGSLPATTSSDTDSNEEVVAETPLLSATILNSAVYMQHGQSTDKLLSAIKAGELDMNLDPELVNEEGFPIISVRIEDLDEEAQRTELAEWEEDNQYTKVSWTAEHIRAIAASTEVAKQLVDEALTHPLLNEYLEEENQQQKTLIELPSLRFSFVHPAHWEQAVCDAVKAWFVSVVQDQGWPEEKLVLTFYPQTHFTQAVKLIEKLIVDSDSQSIPLFNMVISCASFINEPAIDSWPTLLTQLFGSKHNPASVPSEGAAGLLLADNSIAAGFESSSKTTIHKPWFAEIDANQQTSETERKNILAELINLALEKSKLSPENIKFVAADTSSYTKKLLELFNIGSDLFPDLDAGEGYFSSSNQCGVIGTSASLLALAIAHEAVKQEEDDAAIFISHMDNTMRAVAVIDTYKDIEPPAPEDVDASGDTPTQS